VSTHRYIGVTLAYASTVNPEPGIKRAPTLEEQERALSSAVGRHGGVLIRPVVTARQNEGLEPRILALIDQLGADAMIFLTIDSLRRGNFIDVALLQSIWDATGRIDLLIEDVRLKDDASFSNYLNMVTAINEVRMRDTSSEWSEMIATWDLH
jgi:hypothetical protein